MQMSQFRLGSAVDPAQVLQEVRLVDVSCISTSTCQQAGPAAHRAMLRTDAPASERGCGDSQGFAALRGCGDSQGFAALRGCEGGRWAPRCWAALGGSIWQTSSLASNAFLCCWKWPQAEPLPACASLAAAGGLRSCTSVTAGLLPSLPYGREQKGSHSESASELQPGLGVMTRPQGPAQKDAPPSGRSLKRSGWPGSSVCPSTCSCAVASKDVSLGYRSQTAAAAGLAHLEVGAVQHALAPKEVGQQIGLAGHPRLLCVAWPDLGQCCATLHPAW